MIYLATPYTGNEEVNYYWTMAVLYKLRTVDPINVYYSPIATWHPIAQQFKMKGDFEAFKQMSLRGIYDCDIFGYCSLPGHRNSTGMAAELDYAMSKNKKVFLIIPTLPDWNSHSDLIVEKLVVKHLTINKDPKTSDYISLPD